MPVSHAHKTIFVHVPRTAGSSIEQVLGIWGDDNKGTLTPARPDMLFGLVGTKALQHLNARDVRDRLGDEVYRSYFKFAIVRNPYDRVVSTYHIRKKHFPKIQMSFPDFVQKRIAGKKSFFRDLFMSKAEKALEDQFEGQHEFLSDEKGALLVDFIGKYESLDGDFEKIGDRLGLKVKLPKTNLSRHEDYRKYYDEELKKTVRDVYRKDFEAFGYEF